MGSVSETSSLKLYSSNYESNFGSILPFQKSLVTMHRNNSGENGQIMSTAKKASCGGRVGVRIPCGLARYLLM